MENLELTQEWDKVFPKSNKVDHQKIIFHNRYGITLAADMYTPKNAAGKLSAIAVSGPFGAVKEQSSGLYAQTMAEFGFLTIAFDPSFTGESGGSPRYVASPDINTEDFCAAVDFLSVQENVDPDRIGIIGRSAGGHLSALAAMNSDLYESEEWSGYSSKVQACCDMFGPVDFLKLIEIDEHEIATNPNFRWKSMSETHEGALMGGDPATLRERSKEFCPPYILTKEMCPMLILHGDCDKLVPCSISEEFYDKIVEAGMEDRADLYILAGAGHGTKEFFQPETKEIICAFFDKNLK